MQRPTELFNTLPSALPMLWNEQGRVKADEVAKLLDISSAEFARAAHLPQKGFSLKADLPPDVERRVREWVAVIEVVGRFFEGDVRKTALWFRIPNPLLGDIEPRLMIQLGRAQKLLQIVRSEIAGEVA